LIKVAVRHVFVLVMLLIQLQ